jgi:hypothetical protein
MATCTRLVVSNGSVNFSMADPRHNAIRLTFKVTFPEQEPPGTLYINIVSYMISYLRSYPISGIVSIGYMYIRFLLTYTAPVAEWHMYSLICNCRKVFESPKRQKHFVEKLIICFVRGTLKNLSSPPWADRYKTCPHII